MVNGEFVVDEGRITNARPGRPVYGPGYRGARSAGAVSSK